MSAACVVKRIFNTYINVRNNNDSIKAFDKILTGIMYGDLEQGDVVSLQINYDFDKDCGDTLIL